MLLVLRHICRRELQVVASVGACPWTLAERTRREPLFALRPQIVRLVDSDTLIENPMWPHVVQIRLRLPFAIHGIWPRWTVSRSTVSGEWGCGAPPGCDRAREVVLLGMGLAPRRPQDMGCTPRGSRAALSCQQHPADSKSWAQPNSGFWAFSPPTLSDRTASRATPQYLFVPLRPQQLPSPLVLSQSASDSPKPSMAATSPTPSATPIVASEKLPHPFEHAATELRFRGLDKEFNDDLELVPVDIGEKEQRKILKARQGRKQYLPGQPRMRLDKPMRSMSGDNKDPLLEYLTKCHSTKGLDDLLPFMRYIFVQTPSYKHIMPLHHQTSHARAIKVTEHPGLHLVWYYEFIFIKPMPAYFYSQAFWDYIENADPELHKCCLGFMRSYYMLIQYDLDFHQACELRLIPAKANGESLSYEEWCEFIQPFSQVGDAHVNRRYHYGELRLTRINRAALLFRGSLAYFHIYPQWGSFLEHTLTPIITVFAISSVVLNSMQVSLAAIDMGGKTDLTGAWPKFIDASLWFPIVVMLSIAFILFGALLGMGVMGVKDLIRGNKIRQRKKEGKNDGETRSHGMVW